MLNPTQMTSQQARHLLVRTGFAPTQAEVDRLVGKSAQQAVSDIVTSAVAAKPKYPAPAFVSQPPPTPSNQLKTVDERQEQRRAQIAEGVEIKAWWLREMLETPTPLAERMVLFWHNHFATSQQKVVRSQAMWRQHQLFRTQALGSFASLLHGIAKDPAMLVYLDAANSRRESPNENFAREVMELFTLGEATQGGGYNEQDIKEVARAFTGWSVDRDDFSFKYRERIHDIFSKTVLGKVGNFNGDDVLNIMLEQTACGEFIIGKLWKEFVSPAPTAADMVEIKRIAKRFASSGYAIDAALSELFITDAFWADSNRGSLIKSPVDLVVGTVRQFGFSYSDVMPFVRKAAQLGQNLLMPPNVKGWPGHTDWINTTTLLERKSFTQQLFRSIEPVANSSKNPEMNPEKNPAKGRMARFKVGKTEAMMALDADAFLRPYGGRADGVPNDTSKMALADVLLASSATQNIANGTVGVNYLRTLTLDPAYQLK
jgi:uncharacterized protein (DUF1800 family)